MPTQFKGKWEKECLNTRSCLPNINRALAATCLTVRRLWIRHSPLNVSKVGLSLPYMRIFQITIVTSEL